MSTNFTEKFAPSIVSVLGCLDRVIFKGHLPFGRDEHLNGWVDGCLKIRRRNDSKARRNKCATRQTDLIRTVAGAVRLAVEKFRDRL